MRGLMIRVEAAARGETRAQTLTAAETEYVSWGRD